MTRLRLRLGLSALALLLVAPAASAQHVPTGGARLAPAEHAPGGIHIVTMLPDGSLGCDVATEAEAEELRLADRSAGEVRLTPLPSLNRPGVSQFRIIIRATDQLLARPVALLAFRRAAARWERIIQSPVTTVIDLDYGPNRFNSGPFGPGVIASANSAQQFVSATASSGEVRDAIRARMTNPALIALVNSVVVPTPSTAGGENGSVSLGRGISGITVLQSLGFRPAVLDPDPAVNPFGSVPNIGFNSAFSYDFNPNDGISASLTDFEGVVVHEIGHTLGFTSAIGQASASSALFTPWDFFRVRPEAVTPGESLTDGAGWEVAPRVITPGPVNSVPIEPGSAFLQAVQVIFDSEAEYETSTATGGRTGGDGQQASHWRDDALRPPTLGAARKIGIMDPNFGNGEVGVITAADIRTLELLGYVVNSTPSTAAAALTVGGQPVNIDFIASTARGSVPLAGGSVPVVVANVGTGTTPLDFAFEVVVDSVQTLTPGPAPTVSITPADGSIPTGGQATLALTVSGVAGGAVVYGRFYLRTNDPGRAFSEVPFEVSVGSPGIAPTAAAVEVSVLPGQTAPASVEVRSSGDAPLTYLRVLEPAASDPATALQPLEGEAVAAPAVGPVAETAPTADGADDATAARALAQLNITGGAAFRLYDLAQLPTGDIVAVDGGVADSTRIFMAPADLSSLTRTYSSTASLGGQVTGIAYNKRTASLWVAVQETGLVREIRLEGNDIVLTGQQFATGVAPFGMDYSPELDAFFVGVFNSGALYAFETDGDMLPAYPVGVPAREGSNTNAGLSFTEGLLEMQTTPNRYFQAGQFGRTVTGNTPAALPVTGFGLQRSKTDPNGTIYFSSRTSGAGVASIRTLDPPDLPAGVGTRLEAGGPLYSAELLAPGTTRSLALVVDGTGLGETTVTDELAFLTNAPTARIVRFPVTINVTAVAEEDGAADAVDAVATWPNPARAGAQVRLTLGSAATVTVAVYNTLGQRVAVLAQDAPLSVGTHALALPTADLAAGVYVVRVEAGGDVSTHKVTVIR
jgi:hypothetical protein